MKIGITVAVIAILAVYAASIPGKASPMPGMSKIPSSVIYPLRRVNHCEDPACMDVYSECVSKLRDGENEAECIEPTFECQAKCEK